MAFEKIWFIGDSHFSHKNIISYCGRPFENIEEMNKALISNWNKVVGHEDRVFMLGDFALCGKDKIIEFGQSLKGRKILLLGNHDGASLNTYYNAGFEMVSRFPIFWNGFILSHAPVPECQYPNIHGHLHQKDVEDCEDFVCGAHPYVNVSADKINFEPIEFKRLDWRRTHLI